MNTDFITNYLEQLVGYIGANPALAGVICFAVAMGEALFLIGLFFPSTVVLVGAGTLIGLGELDFTEIFLWTVAGAVAGDAVSYWAGYFMKDKLRSLWPLSRYTSLVDQGERYFEKHGGKSVFIGRFVPGVKSVVAGIAGMARMNVFRFQVVNVASAICWTAAHLLPGVLAGSALGAIGAVNTRLAIVLGGLLLALLIAFAVIRWMIMFMIPIFSGTHQAIVNWFAKHPNRVSQWIAKTYDPANPRSVGMLLSAIVLLSAFPVFVAILKSIAPGRTMVRADESISTLFSVARTPMVDQLMTGFTMMGDAFVTVAVAAVAIAYLLHKKAWRRAAGVLIAVGSSALFVTITKAILERERPIALYEGASSFSFPSGHTTINTVLMGVLAVLIAHDRSARSKTVIYTLTAAYSILMGFSRIYLNAHWLSDVLAGLIFGAGITAAFAFVFGHVHNEKVGRNILAFLVVGTILAVSSINMAFNFQQAMKSYKPPQETVRFSYGQWRAHGWQKVPARRIDLIGDYEEEIALQWSGTPEELQDHLTEKGWTPAPDWNLTSAVGYLMGETPAADLPPVPAINFGYLPILTMVHETDANHRQVFWLWQSKFKLQMPDDSLRPLFLGTTLNEETVRLFNEISAIRKVKNSRADLEPFTGLSNAVLKKYSDGGYIMLAGPN
ncbi:bifunctional DedA family/phosphatase PAP2 family protein [Flexibacterium corallicola]|uniref:bifunctional DedA family/phosphatase PAP2 family protein n=1 Tax=Flexibacterium corallicola TaxID=3037259 RepID=UPI00286F263E|nr:VTT domain-containing protein [Pseudovibrio sp. M1P-2-3]